MKIRYQLLRAKVTNDNYKDPNAFPVTKKVGETPEGKPKEVQDMIIFCTDYPLKMPVILYNAGEVHDIVAGQPLIEYGGDLWAIYNFTQLKKSKNEIVINLFCLYAGDPKVSPIAQR